MNGEINVSADLNALTDRLIAVGSDVGVMAVEAATKAVWWEGVIAVITAVFIICVVGIMVYVRARLENETWDGGDRAFSYLITGVISLFLLMLVAIELFPKVPQLFAPEWYAIRELMRVAGGN